MVDQPLEEMKHPLNVTAMAQSLLTTKPKQVCSVWFFFIQLTQNEQATVSLHLQDDIDLRQWYEVSTLDTFHDLLQQPKFDKFWKMSPEELASKLQLVSFKLVLFSFNLYIIY